MRIMNTLARFIPMVMYHHVLILLCIVSVVLSSILLAGCSSSNAMSNVYLLSLKYDNTTSPSTPNPAQFNPDIAQTIRNASWTTRWTISEVKVGYLGICVVQQTGEQVCASSADALTNILQARLLVWNQGDHFNVTTIDPLNLIWTAKYFKSEIVFSGLVFIGLVLIFLCALLLSTFPGWHEELDADGETVEVNPFPSGPVSFVALTAAATASLSYLVAALWQHINSSAAATMATHMTYGVIQGTVGTVAMILAWGGTIFSILIVLGLYVMILSVRMLQELADED